MNVKEIRRRNLRALSRSVGGVTRLANLLEKSQSQVSHLIGTNPVKNIGDKFAAAVEKVFQKPTGWLDHFHEMEEESAMYEANTRRAHYSVPIINWQDAPTCLDPGFTFPEKHYTAHIITHIPVSARSFALKVDGDSMEAPTGVSFPKGSTIVVDPEARVASGSFVLAKQNPTSPLVFKQFVIDGNRRYLKPLNPRYPIVEINAHAIISAVVKFMFIEFK